MIKADEAHTATVFLQFYVAIEESTLTSSITAWFIQKLHSIISSACRTTADSTHYGHSVFELLPSEKRIIKSNKHLQRQTGTLSEAADPTECVYDYTGSYKP